MQVEEQKWPESVRGKSLADRMEGSRSAVLTLCDAQGHRSCQPVHRMIAMEPSVGGKPRGVGGHGIHELECTS